MPSPVGHTLVGMACVLALKLPRTSFSTAVQRVWDLRTWLLCGMILANAPDIDYVPGLFVGDFNAYHHLHTHTMGWVFLVSIGVWLAWRSYAPAIGFKEFVFLFAVGASHLAADYMTADSRPPIGIMLWWPLTDTFYISPRTIYWKLMKSDWSDVFQWYNVRAVCVEALWSGLVIALVLFYKTLMPRRSSDIVR